MILDNNIWIHDSIQYILLSTFYELDTVLNPEKQMQKKKMQISEQEGTFANL